jgi:ABC-type transport system involved in multi-copper enzyme maturation permease subunit
MNMIPSQPEIEIRPQQESSSKMNSTDERDTAALEGAVGRHDPGQKASTWRRLLAIARNAFREAVRDRVLYNLVFFVLLLIVGAIFLGELSAAQESKIIIDLGLSAMLLFGAFISIFVGVGLVYKEIERRTIYAIFSKPVGRGEFLVGKYLGLCLTLLVNVLVMGVGLSLALLYVRRGGGDTPILNIWPAILLIYVELMILTAVAILFSSFSTPALSALLTFFVFIIGHFSADLKSFASSTGTTGARYFFGALFYLLPNLSNYSYITPAAHGQTPSPSLVLASLAYAVVYITVLLAAATLIFNRRNFK